MTDEPEDQEGQEFGFQASVPEHVACHNHAVIFPWGSDTFCAHLGGLALRISAVDASIEVFCQDDHVWKPAVKQTAKITSISSGKTA
jgi:hypothetical protein